MNLTAEQKLRMSDLFSVPIFPGVLRREEDHFSSREAPSNKRLVEMIEESSYWMRGLQKASAQLMSIFLIIFILLVSLLSGIAITSLESNGMILFSRSIIAIMIFIISSDILGVLLGFRSSYVAIDEVFKKIEILVVRGYLESDVQLLMMDYNAALEGAPNPLPKVYGFCQGDLNKRWREYSVSKMINDD